MLTVEFTPRKGLTVPEEYGGTDMGYFAHMLAAEENARVAAGVAMRWDANLWSEARRWMDFRLAEKTVLGNNYVSF